MTRRETQIMDIIYAAGAITARGIHERMVDRPTYSTVRTLLAVLERKGHVTRRKDGKSFVYRARRRREKAAESALTRIVDTFFDGSVEQAVSGLLTMREPQLTAEELGRIEDMIEQAKAKL